MTAGNMFEPTTSLSLHRLSRHSLQDRYESDEEAVSESDTGAQDLLSSPVGSRTGIFDSDLSADENSHADPDSDREENTLAPPTVKRARPVSSATLKRNSEATFDADTYVFDPEEQMVLELPPSDSPQLASSTFLQPSVYVWPKQPQSTTRSRSTSPSSVFSVEEADIQVAKEVTITEPGTRPTVVLINALGSLSKTSKSRPSHSRSRESSRTRSVLVRADSRRLTMQRLSDLATKSPRVSEKRSTMKQAPKTAPTPTPAPALEEDTQVAPSATINRVSEIPPVLYFPAPPRTVPTQGYRNRPQTSGFDKAMPPPLPLRTHRPPSMRSISSNSVPNYTSRPSTPFSAEDAKTNNYNDAPSSQLTRPCSPASISSPSSYISSKRVPSTYSVSNILTSRSPLMMRRMTRKHSASSVNSLSSLRSEVGVNGPSSSQISVATQPTPPPSADCHVVRKSSQRRHTRHASVLPSGRGFMGLKLGKRSNTKA